MAVICDDCEQDMDVAAACSRESILLDGRDWSRVRYGAGHIDALAASNGIRCPDCGVLPGGVHHAGCCKETCPACGGQLFCCDCYKDEGGYEDDETEEE